MNQLDLFRDGEKVLQVYLPGIWYDHVEHRFTKPPEGIPAGSTVEVVLQVYLKGKNLGEPVKTIWTKRAYLWDWIRTPMYLPFSIAKFRIVEAG